MTLWTVACQAPLSMRFSMASILEWVAISFSRGSSQTKDQSCISSTDRWILYHWATSEAIFCYFSAKFCLNLFSGKMLGYFQTLKTAQLCLPVYISSFLPLESSVPFLFSPFLLTHLYFKALLWRSYSFVLLSRIYWTKCYAKSWGYDKEDDIPSFIHPTGISWKV